VVIGNWPCLGITNKNKRLCNTSAFRSYGTFFYLVVVLRVKIPSPAVVAFHRNISITQALCSVGTSRG
jgi:hypothetical protein